MVSRCSIPAQSLEWPRRVVVAGFVAVGVWYLTWRVGTLNPRAAILSGLIYAAELFGFATASLHIFMCWRLSVRRAPVPKPDVTVDVFVPTYNESVELVRETLLAAVSMDHAHQTWLLDDGHRPQMQALANELGCRYLARLSNRYAKAGNLNHALAHSDGQLVVVFDADHAPRRDFLTKTLGYFDDPQVAFVQTPQDYYNLDSYQHRQRGRSREIWTEQALFFRVIQRGKDCWNAAFFCGSCAVVRRSALERIGGFATGTVTEDLHTSIRLHCAGFRSIYHAEPLAFGLAPASVGPFITQRVRWGQGAMHVWRKEGIVFNRRLTGAQRLNYLASVMTYFDGWQKAVFYVAPVVVLISGSLPLVSTMSQFLLHFVPYYLLTFWVFEEVGRGYGGVWYIEQYNMARFAAFAWATLAWCLPKLKFNVTQKSSADQKAVRFSAAQMAVLGANLLAIPFGLVLYVHRHELPLAGLVANVVWAAMNCGLAIAVVRHVARVQRRGREYYRFPVPVAAQLDIGDCRIRGTVEDLSAHGLRFCGGVLPNVAVGGRFHAVLTLPDGPLALQGHVCGLTGRLGGNGGATGCRGAFSVGAGDQKRIERFLFGTNLQWIVNGYRDQAQTPLSRLLPTWVSSPKVSPFDGVQWKAAEVRNRDGQSVQTLVSFGTDCSSMWMLSYTPLTQGVLLRASWVGDDESVVRWIDLQRAVEYEQGGVGIFVYRLQNIAEDGRLWGPQRQDARREVA